ncbi:MAG: hypothetical protein IPO32_19715 [Crocinitomicaceae bacterium]|nr:hypothetical protein [Crocinitomicaceae bacterium]
MIYPSPASAEVFLVSQNGATFENANYEIADINGNIVQQGSLEAVIRQTNNWVFLT